MKRTRESIDFRAVCIQALLEHVRSVSASIESALISQALQVRYGCTNRLGQRSLQWDCGLVGRIEDIAYLVSAILEAIHSK